MSRRFSQSTAMRLVLLLCALTGGFSSSHAQSRGPALVIGNTNYPGNVLNNAVNDARDVASALGDLGFQVTLKEDLGVHDLAAAIAAFQSLASSSPGTAVFYFSGHGIQVNGVNYLIPVDAVIGKPSDVPAATVPMQNVFNALGSHSGANIVILDACRNNPFANSTDDWVKGLAAPTNPPPNTLIAYSSSPGSVAEDGVGTHSPFTRSVLKFIHLPGITVPDFFLRVRADVEANTDMIQVPWENTSIAANVYFRDPIFFKAQFTSPADDDAMVLVNGDVAIDWNQDGGALKQIPLTKLSSEVVVKVYNQRSYTGGLPYVGGHLPEGWRYDLQLARSDGSVLINLTGKEDVPADNGPHHGKLFTVATLKLVVDEKTGKVSMTSVDPLVWTH